jgi:hypothetical protein
MIDGSKYADFSKEVPFNYMFFLPDDVLWVIFSKKKTISQHFPANMHWKTMSLAHSGVTDVISGVMKTGFN